jgi:hypothetical protein
VPAPTPSTRQPTPDASVSAKTPQTKTPPKSASPSTEELSLLRSLQAAAADQRRRASEAGATVDQLRAGDDHNTAATSATQQGKITEAAANLNQATAAWTIAERDARAQAAAAASAAAAKTRVTDATPPKTAATPPVTQSAPASQPVVTQPVASQPPPKVVVNPSVEIDAVVANYARAIESKDITEVRRAYPGATQQQLDGFGEFFKSVRSIRAHFNVGSLDVRSDVADARLTGTYDYVTAAGKSEQQSVSFQASFRHDNGVWKLTSVR